jgi:regulator of protease activity HflC (stomatin/prohibitin superfamily)
VEGLIAVVVIVLIAAAGIAVIRSSTVVVYEHQRGLRYRQGRFRGLVDPGLHVVVRPFSEIRILDGRPTAILLPGQEILTSDGVALKLSLSGRYVVDDPVTAVTSDQDYSRALYVALQIGLRSAVVGRTADEILAGRNEIGPAVAAAVASDLARLGVELLDVDVRDVMVPGELKRAFAAVVAARREGEAALERARGETAALRNLANAGRLVEGNPGLLRLRVLQELGGSTGNTVMLSLDGADGASRPPPPPPPVSSPPPAAPEPATRGRGRSRAGS